MNKQFRLNKTRAAIIAALGASLTLAGCGGGGSSGGGHSNVKPNGHSNVKPNMVSSNGGPTVEVAVVDGSVNAAHEQLQGNNESGDPIFRGAYNYADGYEAFSEANQDEASRHGTGVAGIVAGSNVGYSGNASITSYELREYDNGTLSAPQVYQAIGMAAERGAKVINLSNSADPVWGYRKDGRYEPHLQKLIDYNSVVVAGGGNSGKERGNTPSDTDKYDLAAITPHVIYVGGLSSNGETLFGRSNYPGHDSVYQSRWLMANWSQRSLGISNETATIEFSGTSAAAPEVTAAMATLLSEWDHLTSPEAAQRLLDTADRQFSDKYGDNSCGESGNVDCGLYYFGQGKLDVHAAMEPEGELAMAASATVPDGDYVDRGDVSINSTTLVTPAGLSGLDESLQAELREVAVFDELGRDYTADLSGFVTVMDDPTQSSGYRMSQYLANHVAGANQAINADFAGTDNAFYVDAHGQLNAAAIGVDLDSGIGLNAYHFGGGHSAPQHRGNVDLAMMSFSGNTPMADQVENASGFSVNLPLAGGLSFTGDYWQGENRLSLDAVGQTSQVNNIMASLSYEVADGLSVSAGYGTVNESASVMGMMGTGGLATNGGSTMQLMQAGIEYQAGRFSAFANHQQGQLSADFSQSVMTAMDADVSQTALGLGYQLDDRTQVAFVASQPMHLTGGSADMQIAVGRDNAGQVHYDNRSVGLNGADVRVNYELGFMHQASDRMGFGVNIARDQGDNVATGVLALAF